MKKLLFVFVLIPALFYSQNTGLQFDGIGDYIQTGFNGVADSSSRTVQCWYKGGTSGSQRFLVDMGVTSGGNGARFSLKLSPSWSSYARVEIGGGGLDGSTSVTNNAWHQITVVYDDSAATNKYKIYIDGVLDVQGDINIPLNTAATSANPVSIGIRTDLNTTTDLSGSLDEVRIWNIALTPTQITENWNKEICGTPTGLVAYYKMNEGLAGGTNTSITSLVDQVTPSSVNTLVGFNKTGATSNYTLHAIRNGETTSTITINSCSAYTWRQNGVTYSSTGWYVDTLAGSSGCDSIVTLNLIIQSPSAGSISLSGGVLSVSGTGDSYQWLDCGNGNAPVSAADTNQSFTPTTNGSYACVVINANGCIDTTSCYSYNSAGIESASNNELLWNAYPNPATNSVFISLPESNNTANLKMIDALGKLVLETSINQPISKINVADFKPGIYKVILVSNNRSFTKSIIINN